MLSNFSLVSGKYMFHNERCVAVVDDYKLARPLQQKMEAIEVEEGTDAALEILCYIATNSDLSKKIRLPSIADHDAAKSNVVGPDTRYGKKHICLKCTQNFYDLHGKIRACPACKTPLQLT